MNNNETVEQVCENMKEPSIYKGRFPASFFDGEFCAFADRILAAHTREKCEWAASLTKQRSINKELVDENDVLKLRIENYRAIVANARG